MPASAMRHTALICSKLLLASLIVGLAEVWRGVTQLGGGHLKSSKCACNDTLILSPFIIPSLPRTKAIDPTIVHALTGEIGK